MFKQRRNPGKQAARRKVPGIGSSATLARRTPIGMIFAVLVVSPVVEVHWDQSVIYSGVLPGWRYSNKTVIAVEVLSSLVWRVTFSAPIVAGGFIEFPFEDPSARNVAGGFMRFNRVQVAAP